METTGNVSTVESPREQKTIPVAVCLLACFGKGRSTGICIAEETGSSGEAAVLFVVCWWLVLAQSQSQIDRSIADGGRCRRWLLWINKYVNNNKAMITSHYYSTWLILSGPHEYRIVNIYIYSNIA